MSEWQEVVLTDIYDISSGLSKPADSFGSGYPFLSFKDVFNNYFVPDELSQLVESSEDERLKGSIKRGDVFLTRTSETMHELGMSSVALKDYPDATFNGFTKRLRLKEDALFKVYPEFIAYYLRSPKFRQGMLAFSTMSTRASLNNGMIGTLKIKLPPIETQKSIARVLKSLDDKIKLNRQINQTLEQIAQTIFKSWFVDFEPVKAKIQAKQNGQDTERAAMRAISGKTDEELDQLSKDQRQQLTTTAALFPDEFEDSELGEIPYGWGVKKFGDVSRCFDSKRVPLSKKQREEKKPGNIPYYGATSIMDYVNEWIFEDIYLLLGEDGSVIKENGTPFIQYIWGKAWVNNHAHVLQGKNGVSTEQLMIFIQNQNITAYITGAVQLKLNQGNMNSIPFLDSGEVINLRFYDIIKPLYEKIRNISEESQTLGVIRDELLPKLLSGQIAAGNAQSEEEAVA